MQQGKIVITFAQIILKCNKFYVLRGRIIVLIELQRYRSHIMVNIIFGYNEVYSLIATLIIFIRNSRHKNRDRDRFTYRRFLGELYSITEYGCPIFL